MSSPPLEILIVDDEAALLRLMSVYLHRLGYSTITANTTVRTWEHLNQHPGQTAAVVLDAGMAAAGIDDLAIKLLAAHPRLRILITSGYPVDMSVLQQAMPGRVEFLHKPFSPEMLAEALRRMLGPQEEEV